MNDKNNMDWINLTRRTNDPKLSWLKNQLDSQSIPCRQNGDSLHGPILQVPREFLAEAWDFLNIPIGQLFIGTSTDITYDDLPDNHFLFSEWNESNKDESNKDERHNLHPDAYAFISRQGRSQNVQFPGVTGPVEMMDVDSSNLSALGYKTLGGQCALYVRFKGGTYYRYVPVSPQVIADLAAEMWKSEAGEPEASVGSLFHHAVKAKADAGTIECYKLEGDVWIVVPPKAQRTQIIKEKHK